MGKSENSGFFRNCDLKVGRCIQLIEIMNVCLLYFGVAIWRH